MYVVIKAFSDLTDPVKFREVKEGRLPLRYREYKVGDVYPHPDAPFPTQERVAELAGSSNKQGTPLIAWVEDQTEETAPEPVEEPVEEAPEKTAPKRKARTKKE
jgi:hypothetical protein